jgi:hypothetical protein
MVAGALSPSGARSEGHDAMADASEAHEARMARFLAEAQPRVRDHVPRVFEFGAGMKQVIKIEDVVVNSGRRPHGWLHFKDEFRDGRAGSPRG